MDFEDLHIGMVVKISHWDYRPDHWAEDGEMDEWCGDVVTIAELDPDDERVFIEEDDRCWQWYAEDFEPYCVLKPNNPNRLYAKKKRDDAQAAIMRRIDALRKEKKGG